MKALFPISNIHQQVKKLKRDQEGNKETVDDDWRATLEDPWESFRAIPDRNKSEASV